MDNRRRQGNNVARVLKELGWPALATGFIGGRNGEEIVSRVDDEGIKHDFVRVRGETRLCIKVMDPVNGTQTEINENGPRVTLKKRPGLCSIRSMGWSPRRNI